MSKPIGVSRSSGRVLRCGCCGLPFARIENGYIVVESRHRSGVHTSSVRIADLARAEVTGDVPVTSIPYQIKEVSQPSWGEDRAPAA